MSAFGFYSVQVLASNVQICCGLISWSMVLRGGNLIISPWRIIWTLLWCWLTTVYPKLWFRMCSFECCGWNTLWKVLIFTKLVGPKWNFVLVGTINENVGFASNFRSWSVRLYYMRGRCLLWLPFSGPLLVHCLKMIFLLMLANTDVLAVLSFYLNWSTK